MKRHWHMPYILLLRRLIPLLLVLGCAAAGEHPSAPTPALSIEPASALMLPAPSDPDQRLYLGIDDRETFSLDDIRAEVVLIEAFSMYCPHCQHEAPNVNRLYRRIADDPLLAAKVKMIGIGVGNTRYEVDAFRKRFEVPFPLFPDRSRLLARRLEVHVTPTFVAFADGSDGRRHPILRAPGPLGDVEQFLTRLLERAEAAKDIGNGPSLGGVSLSAAMEDGNTPPSE